MLGQKCILVMSCFLQIYLYTPYFEIAPTTNETKGGWCMAYLIWDRLWSIKFSLKKGQFVAENNYFVTKPNLVREIRGRPFNFWGGGGFRKKIPALTNWGKNILPHYLVGKKCCKTAWLQGSIWLVPEDQLVWFSRTSVMLISCWKTPQNAGNSLSELQEIKNFLGRHAPRPL
jgi:hypothetical protein